VRPNEIVKILNVLVGFVGPDPANIAETILWTSFEVWAKKNLDTGLQHQYQCLPTVLDDKEQGPA
jgi:hypothetical protein